MNRKLLHFTTVNKPLGEIDTQGVFERNCCYGQRCEDFLVNLIFKNKTDGVVMDIGAHDGLRFSNSFAFSNLGWKGVLVEAHPDYYNICQTNRHADNTKICYVACGKNDEDNVTFYSNYRGSLSTLNPNLNERYKNEYKGYYVDRDHTERVQNFTNGPILVKTKKLDSIIEENKEFLGLGVNLDQRDIDLISIDVDGSEEYVFAGFDIEKYRPRVVILEMSVVRSIVEDFMSKTTYTRVYDNGLNAIYCRDQVDVKTFTTSVNALIANKTVVTSFDTGHPLGN